MWKALLSEEKPEELLERLQKYLDRTEREGMITRELLVALRTDLTQVVYAWLSEREIKAYALFADADMENLHRNSLYGREEMMEYAGVLVRKAVQYRQYINKSDSVTSQVCAYIDAHYREEIHREELGELDTPNGHFTFLQAAAITEDEMNAMMCWNGEKFLEIGRAHV